jgi:hypothetical protein
MAGKLVTNQTHMLSPPPMNSRKFIPKNNVVNDSGMKKKASYVSGATPIALRDSRSIAEV